MRTFRENQVMQSGGEKAAYFVLGGVSIILVFVAAISVRHGANEMFWICGCLITIFVVSIAIIRSRQKRRCSFEWQITDDALIHIVGGETKDTIPWKEIEEISRTERGILMRRTGHARSNQAVFDLCIGTDDAEFLIAQWKKCVGHGRVGKDAKKEQANLFTPRQTKLLQLISVLVFATGIVVLFFFGNKLYRQWSSLYWPSVGGRVLEVSYSEFSSSRSGGASAELRVSYTYNVDGRVFQSVQYSIGNNKLKGTADRIALLTNRFRIGENIKVHYDPANPSQSVIDATPYWIDAGYTISGGIICVVGFGFWRMASRGSELHGPNSSNRVASKI